MNAISWLATNWYICQIVLPSSTNLSVLTKLTYTPGQPPQREKVHAHDRYTHVTLWWYLRKRARYSRGSLMSFGIPHVLLLESRATAEVRFVLARISAWKSSREVQGLLITQHVMQAANMTCSARHYSMISCIHSRFENKTWLVSESYCYRFS